MAKTLEGFAAISGRLGRAYIKNGGNNEEMFYAKSIEATAEKSKVQVKSIGKNTIGHKTTGLEITGKMTLYYFTSLFRKMLADYKRTGIDLYFDMVIENDDPASPAGKQAVLLRGVNLDSVVLAKLDGDGDDPLEEEIEFTAEDWEILQSFRS